MTNWFVRSGGKVFGPFASDRLLSLVGEKKFDSDAEYGETWEGPWKSWASIVKTVTTLQSAVSQPALMGDFSSAEGDCSEQSPATDEQSGRLEVDRSFSPALVITPAEEGLGVLHAIEQRLPVIAVAAVAVVFGVTVFSCLGANRTPRSVVDAGKRNSAPPSGGKDDTASASSVFADASDGPDVTAIERSRDMASPTTEANRTASELPKAQRPAMKPAGSGPRPEDSGDAATISLGDPYEVLAEPVIEAVQSLRQLQAAIDVGGMNRDRYAQLVGEHLVKPSLFATSHEAKRLPELAILVATAQDSYKMAREAWQSVAVEQAVSQQQRGAVTPPQHVAVLWEVAREHVELAYLLTSRDPKERQEAFRRLQESEQRRREAFVRAKNTYESVRSERHDLSSLVMQDVPNAEGVGQKRERTPPVESDPEVLERRQKLKSFARDFRESNFDVGKLQEVAELLEKDELLVEDDQEVVKDVLKLLKPRDWITKNGDKSNGRITAVRTGQIIVDTVKYDGPLSRDILANETKKVVAQIELKAKELWRIAGERAGDH